jgi:hypothetical protein
MLLSSSLLSAVLRFASSVDGVCYSDTHQLVW